MSNYLKSSQKSLDIILKSEQNVWSDPKGAQKSVDIILKSAQTSSNYNKSAKNL